MELLFPIPVKLKLSDRTTALTGVSRHFGPRTLRTQDISALVTKCP